MKLSEICSRGITRYGCPYQFLDGDYLYGVQIEDHVPLELIAATDADNTTDAIAELRSMGVGLFWLGLVSEEDKIKTDFLELSGEITVVNEDGIESQIPVFRGWGGVQK